jgi:hypothetical protein
MPDAPDVLLAVCGAIEDQRLDKAASMLNEHYPFVRLANAGRRYSAVQSMRVFLRDGFTDRYTGHRLVFPGTLRLISQLLPAQFPFHNNWKTDACHFGYYELFPTIDHLMPVSRGGGDCEANWVSTSMIRNAAKANFTVEELGWRLHPPGELESWDGLTGWFLRQWPNVRDRYGSPYLRQWADAAVRAGYSSN